MDMSELKQRWPVGIQLCSTMQAIVKIPWTAAVAKTAAKTAAVAKRAAKTAAKTAAGGFL